MLTSSLSEFLENFYLKYGGFIPLSETDVLEYLKKKGNSDLSQTLVCTQTQSVWMLKGFHVYFQPQSFSERNEKAPYASTF